MNIQFFGSSKNSAIVKNALLQADYRLVTSNPDLIIVADYGQVIPQSTLRKAKKGNLNIHPSLLPKYRGATPVQRTLLNQEKETGVTIIEMTGQVDAGPIVAQKKLKINPQDTSITLLIKLFTLGANLLVSILPQYLEGKITPRPQPTDSPTPYCQKFKKTDGYISFKDFVKHSFNQFQDIDHQIKALVPWPTVHTTLPNGKHLKLLPNQMVQLEGKQPITFKQFQAGYQHLLKLSL